MSDIWTLPHIQDELDDNGFCGFLGMVAKDFRPEDGVLVLDLPFKPVFGRGGDNDYAHGGVIGAFVDTAATFAVMASGSENCVTTNYRLDLLRPVMASTMTATATLIRKGRTLALVDVNITDEAGKLCATGRASFAILG